MSTKYNIQNKCFLNISTHLSKWNLFIVSTLKIDLNPMVSFD